MFVYWSTVIFLKLKFLCKKGFFVFALCFRFVFSLCVFALCFRFVFSFCVFALCFRFVFSLCVFVLCFRFVFSLSVFVLKTPHLRKQVRLQENKRAREEEDAMTYNDFDWDKHVNMNTLKSLKTKSLDKYLTFHNLKHCLKLKKQQKIETIKEWHFGIVNDNIQGEKEPELDDSEAEMEDNDDVIQTTVVADGDESDGHDSKADNLA